MSATAAPARAKRLRAAWSVWPRTGRGTLLASGLLAVGLLAVATNALLLWRESAKRERGAALFEGATALPGRLVGHDTTLPSLATRCTNCHDGATPTGGAITATRLTVAQSRRGGPPVAYNASTLCELLRTGIDPARVLIAPLMPRYDLSEIQCTELWAYLSTR